MPDDATAASAPKAAACETMRAIYRPASGFIASFACWSMLPVTRSQAAQTEPQRTKAFTLVGGCISVRRPATDHVAGPRRYDR
jgi:hypothetical protein